MKTQTKNKLVQLIEETTKKSTSFLIGHRNEFKHLQHIGVFPFVDVRSDIEAHKMLKAHPATKVVYFGSMPAWLKGYNVTALNFKLPGDEIAIQNLFSCKYEGLKKWIDSKPEHDNDLFNVIPEHEREMIVNLDIIKNQYELNIL